MQPVLQQKQDNKTAGNVRLFCFLLYAYSDYFSG